MSELAPFDAVTVVKVGTTSMFRHESGRELLNHASLERIGGQVLSLRDQGHHVALVSSGAVTAGLEATGQSVRPTGQEAMPEVQRLATLGWHRVLSSWGDALPGVNIGGLLVTKRELNLDTPEHDEVLRTTYTLLSHNDVPVLNENDAVTHAELSHQSFGQNDTLAAIYAAQIAGSSLFRNAKVRLVLLSDVDGVYADIEDTSSVIRQIDDLSQYQHIAGESNNGRGGKGGMKTKFAAARIATPAGVEMWIANGQVENAIQRTLAGEIGTHFTA